MESNSFNETIGIWISDKKSQKLNWKELINTCAAFNYNVVKLDLDQSLDDQARIDVFLHKLTDIIAAADQGDPKASIIINRVEQFLSNHPEIVVIDPLESVRILLNRNCYYSILQDETSFSNQGIFTPNFAEFTYNVIERNIEIMKQRGVTFPLVCKPTLAHGSKSAHEMVIIFNEKDLGACKPPCVVQSFVNHNAVLHKVFLVGDRYHICERPSIKNFTSSENLDPIYYSTGEVCKADSQSTLSILDPHDNADITLTVNEEKIKSIIQVLRKKIGLLLAGFDVVIDNTTGNHAVIDINVFPSYDNFPNFFEHLLDSINNIRKANGHINGDCNGISDLTNRLNGLYNVGRDPVKYGVKGMNVD